jgi:hypothetical protein
MHKESGPVAGYIVVVVVGGTVVVVVGTGTGLGGAPKGQLLTTNRLTVAWHIEISPGGSAHDALADSLNPLGVSP